MFKRLISLEDNFSIAKAASIVGVFTLITKFVAIYRERLFAITFGQGAVLDSYFSAFRIPDFITNLFLLSTLSVAFLPVFSSVFISDEKKSYRLANSVLNAVCLVLALLCGIVLIFSRPLMHWLVPGFDDHQFAETLNLTRLFLLSPLLFTLSTVYGGILNAKKKFIITSIAPILYNAGIIFGIVFFYPRFGSIGLGYGVLFGALLQLLIQVVTVYRSGYRYSPIIETGDSEARKILRLYVPRIFAFDLSNVTLLLGTIIGSTLVSGSITALNQAYNLQSVPVGIFGYSIAVAAFPTLSEQFAKKNRLGFIATLRKSIEQTLLFIIPLSILTLLYRAYVVRLILGAGRFSWEDTIRTFEILGIFSFSFFSQCLTTLLARAFFARHNTKVPVMINVISVVINTVAGVILGRLYGVMGLTVAFVLASIFNALTLFVFLKKDLAADLELGEAPVLDAMDKQLGVFVLKTLFGSIIMGAGAYVVIQAVGPWLNTRTVLGILVQCSISFGYGLILFAIVANWLGISQVRSTLEMVSKKIKIKI